MKERDEGEGKEKEARPAAKQCESPQPTTDKRSDFLNDALCGHCDFCFLHFFFFIYMLAVFVYWLTVSHPDTLTAHQSQIVQGGLENSANYVCMCLTVLHSGKAKRQCASVCWPISNPFQMVLLLTCFVLSSSFLFISCE